MVRRPPDLAAEAIAARAERFDDGGEEQRLADGDDLRLETLLRTLRPEGREVGRDHVAGDDLRAGLLEGGDLRGEIIGERLVAARIDELEAGLLQRWREADLGV